MERNLRGAMEILCDSFLTEVALSARINYFNQLKDVGMFNSIEDALFGSMTESLMASCAVILISRGSKISANEMRAIREIIVNRSAEIKSKIATASNL